MSLNRQDWLTLRSRPLLFMVLLTLLWGLAACGGAPEPPAAAPPAADVVTVADPEKGAALYTTCAGCHGADGKGISGLGAALTENPFITSHSDTELVAFLKAGRAVSDPDNRTGLFMPPMGGNPSLREQDMHNIVAFLRTLEGNNE